MVFAEIRTSGKNRRCMSALECLFHGTGGWSGCFAGKRICRKGKTGDLSGTGISERRTGGAWLSSLSFSGELRGFFTGPADLYEKLEQKKILIRDCSNYTGLSKGYYRVAVKKHEENQQLVRALKEIDRTKVENVIL